MRLPALALLLVLPSLTACKSRQEEPAPAAPAAPAPSAQKPRVGLVLSLGGRGDQSFNDSALRGLEEWAAGVKYTGMSYQTLPADARQASLRGSLGEDRRDTPLAPLDVSPLVLQSRVAEDYEPNLQLLADQGVKLSLAVGFLLENAVETAAKKDAAMHFLLVDSPLLTAQGEPYTLPNVRTVVFREEEGSFLVGALAGLVTQGNKVGFVGGMEVPLIKKFEAGFRAGVAATNPKATVVVNYTGSFDNVAMGKQVGQDVLAKGADIIYQAAGSDGLGVIQAVKEARDANKAVFVIGVDSDQSHLAPEAVLTSMVKRVDLAVYEAVRDLNQGKLQGGDVVLGLKEGGVTYSPVRVEFPKRAEALEKIEELRARIVSGELKVPSNPAELPAAPAGK